MVLHRSIIRQLSLVRNDLMLLLITASLVAQTQPSGEDVLRVDPALDKLVQWNHPLGEVVTALPRAGLTIDSLRELDRSVLRDWEIMAPAEDGMYRMPSNRASLPLMYVLRAHREQ